MELQRVWHEYRTELEDRLLQLTGPMAAKRIHKGRSGDYKRDVFMGHCSDYGGAGYVPIALHDRVIMKRIPETYAYEWT